MEQLDELKVSCGFEPEDEHYLQLAGPVLADQTKAIVDHWRSGVIAGHPTLNPDASSIPAYGCLGFDSSHNVLYVSRQASKAADKAILVFGAGQFNGGFNQAPERTLDDSASSLRNLRFIFHANSKDWLAGMDWLPPFQAPPVAPGKKAASKGNHMLHLWKSPSTGGTATPVNLDPDIQVGGIAFAAH